MRVFAKTGVTIEPGQAARFTGVLGTGALAGAAEVDLPAVDGGIAHLVAGPTAITDAAISDDHIEVAHFTQVTTSGTVAAGDILSIRTDGLYETRSGIKTAAGQALTAASGGQCSAAVFLGPSRQSVIAVGSTADPTEGGAVAVPIPEMTATLTLRSGTGITCVANVLVLLCGTAHAQTFKPLCRSASGKVDQCVGTLANAQAPTAPTMSGANITAASVPAAKITGGTLGRLLFDNGTAGDWTAVGTTGWILQSNGGVIAPSFTNVIAGITISGASNTITNLPTSSIAPTFLLPAANGGTGKATWTVGSIPVASGVTTIAEIAPGTAGHVLTSNGAGVAPSMQAPVTANTAAGTAGASHSLTTNAYEAIPSLSVSLAAGTWSCQANVRSVVRCSAGAGYITLKLYNITGATDIAHSERIGTVCGTTGQSFTATTPISEVFTIGSTSTIQVYAVSPVGATYTERTIYSDSDGRSRLVCHRLA